MGRTLILASPPMSGPDVLETQRLMMALDGSPYHTWDGPSSGIYGPRTADAVYHSKYVLGYSLPDIDHAAGDTFRGLLRTPVASLPEDYQARRQQRLNPPAIAPRVLALRRAASQVGVRETGENHNPFGVWYRFDGVAWCAIFQTWAGEPYEAAWERGSHYSYVPAIYRDALAHQRGLSVVADPIPGDLVLYFWLGYHVDERESHVGRVESGNAAAWVAIEGNTSPDAGGSQGNGGGVYRRHRSAKDAEHYFVRIGH